MSAADFQPFRGTAHRRHQRAFDRALLHARTHAAPAVMVNPTDPEKLALFSMIVGLQYEILELREELELPIEGPEVQ